MNSAWHWIERLELQQHPEGGWFREVYRSSESIATDHLPRRFRGNRVFSTAIYYLLSENDFSTFHRIKQDEIWHYYDGGSLIIHMIDPQGEYSAAALGKRAGQLPIAVVPAGWWFAAEVAGRDGFVLAGCTVAPGFEFDDLQMPTRQYLLEKFPQHQGVISQLTRPE